MLNARCQIQGCILFFFLFNEIPQQAKLRMVTEIRSVVVWGGHKNTFPGVLEIFLAHMLNFDWCGGCTGVFVCHTVLNYTLKMGALAGRLWLMPVILATLEAEIWRIEV
jgi:hypothetical protein